MRAVWLILLIGAFSIASAQSVYSIDTLISMMLKNHPTIKAQKFALKGANAQLNGAKWGYFPSLSAEGNQEITNSGEPGAASVTLSQPLWTGGKLNAEYDIASAHKDESIFALLESKYTLVSSLLDVLKKYINNKANSRVLLVGKIRLITLESMLSRRVNAGVSSRSDMVLLKKRLYQIETDMQQAIAATQTSLTQISLYTAHKFNKSLSIKRVHHKPGSLKSLVRSMKRTHPLFDEFHKPSSNKKRVHHKLGSLKSLVRSMKRTHPLLKKYDALIAKAKAETLKAKAALYPNLSANLKHDFGGSSDTTKTNDTKAYLALKASFGSGFSGLSKIKQAETKIAQLFQEKKSVEQKLTNKMIVAYNTYISSSKLIRSQSASVTASKEVFESYKRLFLIGRKEWLDLVNASRDITQNEIQLNQTKTNRLISAYTLLLLSGQL